VSGCHKTSQAENKQFPLSQHWERGQGGEGQSLQAEAAGAGQVLNSSPRHERIAIRRQEWKRYHPLDGKLDAGAANKALVARKATGEEQAG
jgi:hypothetical protein